MEGGLLLFVNWPQVFAFQSMLFQPLVASRFLLINRRCAQKHFDTFPKI